MPDYRHYDIVFNLTQNVPTVHHCTARHRPTALLHRSVSINFLPISGYLGQISPIQAKILTSLLNQGHREFPF